MDSNDPLLRAVVRRSLEIIGDAADPPRPFDELGVSSGTAGDEHAHRSRRARAVMGALATVVALVGGLLVVRSATDDPAEVGGVDTIPAAPIPAGLATTVPPAPVTAPAATAPPTTSVDTTVVSTVPPTTSVEPGLSVEDVRAMQAAALRALPGFTATVAKTVFDPVSNEPSSEETAQITIVADRSFWADRGLRGWGSYDPRTHIVRGAFALPDGTLGYQEIVGQPDGFTPLGILVGYDPTVLVMATPDGPILGNSTEVIETTFEGRPVWEVTIIQAFDAPCFEVCSEEDDTKIVQTEVSTVDQETGIVIRKSTTSTQPNQTPQLSVLRDIRVTDAMPAPFPGTFPDDAVVDRSGDPNAAAVGGMARVQALADAFGIAIPLPTGPIEISTRENGGSLMGPDGVDVPGRFHTIEVASHEGFVTAAAVNLMFSAPVAESPVPDGWTVVNGLYCTSPTDDGVCDERSFGNVTEIESGALAGGKLMGPADAPYGSITFGPFQIGISAPDAATVLAIANRFEMVEPS